MRFKYLDSALGLKMMGGNETFYKKFLNDFFKVNKNEIKQLDVLFDSEPSVFKRKVHIIKGQAGTIGAIKLQDLAKELEECMSREKLNNFSKEFALLIEELERSSYLLKSEKIEINRSDVSIENINSLFAKLKSVLHNSKPLKVNELMKQISAYQLSEQDQKLLSEVKVLVEQYQFKSAYQAIQMRKSSYFEKTLPGS